MKGAEVRIIGRKYVRSYGSYNNAKTVTKDFYYVIIKTPGGEKWTRIKKINVTTKEYALKHFFNLAEAVLNQHPDINMVAENAARTWLNASSSLLIFSLINLRVLSRKNEGTTR